MQVSEAALFSRTPRLLLLANGRVLNGAYEAEVTSNSYYSADRFGAILALDADSWADGRFWSAAQKIVIDIQFDINGGLDFTSVIKGLVDTVSIDHVNRIARISGRDFTAMLTEAQTQEAFSNRTSSEIAVIIAQRHGLTPRVVLTSTPIGRFYQNDHQSLTLERFSATTTEWDLLVYLARQENFDVFLTGDNLCFRPTADGSSADRVISPTEVMDLKLERVLTLARDIQVFVKSWNTQQQTTFSACVSGSIGAGPDNGGTETSPAQKYVVIRPNLTPDRALAMAQQHLGELTRHERAIEFRIPGELSLTPRSIIQLTGTGTDFDQTYYINSIERAFRPRSGFVQRVRASNSSPRTMSILASSGLK